MKFVDYPMVCMDNHDSAGLTKFAELIKPYKSSFIFIGTNMHRKTNTVERNDENKNEEVINETR